MTRSILVTSIFLAAACGGGSAKPAPTNPIADPIPMAETSVEPTPGVEPVKPTEPAVPGQPAAPDPAKVKADLLAAEMTAYENVKPLVGRYCASCHTKGQRGAKAKTLEHFETTTYPFGGHHAMEVGTNVRKVLGIGGGKPTMPKNKPGIVKADELALFAAWAEAFDASHAGGAHEGHGIGGHDHSSINHGTPAPTNTKTPTPSAKPAAPTRFDIVVTSAGFEPKNVTVPRGKPLVFR